MPQDWSLGPLLFALYILPPVSVTKAHGVSHHQHADDMQLYLSVDKRDLSVEHASSIYALRLSTHGCLTMVSHTTRHN